jgi:hypothetical protein
MYCLCVNVYCTVLLPPGVNSIAVNRYIIAYQYTVFYTFLPRIYSCKELDFDKESGRLPLVVKVVLKAQLLDK